MNVVGERLEVKCYNFVHVTVTQPDSSTVKHPVIINDAARLIYLTLPGKL